MKAIIVGGGIGGLTTALMLRARGIDCELFEQSDTIRELGVGINTLPHAIRELAGIGLLEQLDDVAIRTDVLYYLDPSRPAGLARKARASMPATTCRNSRSTAAACRASSIRRSIERLGTDAIHTGCRLGSFTQDEGGVTAYFFDRSGAPCPDRARRYPDRRRRHPFARCAQTLFADEGPPCWNGLMLWRGAPTGRCS